MIEIDRQLYTTYITINLLFASITFWFDCDGGVGLFINVGSREILDAFWGGH